LKPAVEGLGKDQKILISGVELPDDFAGIASTA
jgi:hypothetical protein